MTSPRVAVYFEPTNFRPVDCPVCGMEAIAFDIASVDLLDGLPVGVTPPLDDDYPCFECDACGSSGSLDAEVAP